MWPDVVVIGAGVAGLTLARELQTQGRRVVVVERARGVGGRCATRRTGDRSIDHGLAFLHGRSARFRAELDAVGDVTRLPNWPVVIDGDGSPCRPEAFGDHEHRIAFAEGVNRFPKHLSRGLDVRLNAEVVGLRPPGRAAAGWQLTLASGERLRAPAVVLTMPAPSAIELLQGGGPLPAVVSGVLPLIALIRMLPCLTVMTGYAATVEPPAWDISFPRSSAVLHSIVHDSRKRGSPAPLTLVMQARPAYSRAHLDDSPAEWSAALVAEAAALHGAWAGQPTSSVAHRWRKARVDAGAELAHPVLVQLGSGELLGFAGDGFHSAGGIEGAYFSGIELAARYAEALTAGSAAVPDAARE